MERGINCEAANRRYNERRLLHSSKGRVYIAGSYVLSVQSSLVGSSCVQLSASANKMPLYIGLKLLTAFAPVRLCVGFRARACRTKTLVLKAEPLAQPQCVGFFTTVVAVLCFFLRSVALLYFPRHRHSPDSTFGIDSTTPLALYPHLPTT